MTVSTTLIGLLPIMVGTATGSQVMKRIAAPMVGGLVTSTILTLVTIPAIYAVIKSVALRRAGGVLTAPSGAEGSSEGRHAQ